MTARQFFTFPSPVNAAESRLHQGLVACLVALSCSLTYFYGIPWLWLYITYGFLMRSLCGPRLDPQVRVTGLAVLLGAGSWEACLFVSLTLGWKRKRRGLELTERAVLAGKGLGVSGYRTRVGLSNPGAVLRRCLVHLVAGLPVLPSGVTAGASVTCWPGFNSDAMAHAAAKEPGRKPTDRRRDSLATSQPLVSIDLPLRYTLSV